MLDWVRQMKRPIMGLTGIVGLVIALLIPTAEPSTRLAGITLCAILICLALPPRVWTNVRAWWTE